MKQELEFFAAEELRWEPCWVDGMDDKVLSRDSDDPQILTRLVRWKAGLAVPGVMTHDWVEEVYILDGELVDDTLGKSFGPGHFASRPPHMQHGPYRTVDGCTMLEIRYRQ